MSVCFDFLRHFFSSFFPTSVILLIAGYAVVHRVDAVVHRVALWFSSKKNSFF